MSTMYAALALLLQIDGRSLHVFLHFHQGASLSTVHTPSSRGANTDDNSRLLVAQGLILGTQGRKIITMVHSFITLGLDFGTYVTHDELVEAGSPDCSICYEPMNVPVKLSCTHMFCEECVMEWFDRERSCPLCRAAISMSGDGTGAGADESKPQFLDGSTSLLPQLL